MKDLLKKQAFDTDYTCKMAICYDFDRTLTPDDMQAQGYIQDLGFRIDEFWENTTKLALGHDMDSVLAYMYMMVQGAKHAKEPFCLTADKLKAYGREISFFEGVEDWFSRINAFGLSLKVELEHYIISSGIREMIEGTAIANCFKQIYANSFLYDENGVASWPSQVVNFTNKTQFLFRISKGTTDLNDPSVNDYMPTEQMRIPFRNMIYIGDSMTDVPCMKLLNSYQGYAVGVYNPALEDKDKVEELLRHNRICTYAPADYRENSRLDRLIKAMIEAVCAREKQERLSQCCS